MPGGWGKLKRRVRYLTPADATSGSAIPNGVRRFILPGAFRMWTISMHRYPHEDVALIANSLRGTRALEAAVIVADR